MYRTVTATDSEVLSTLSKVFIRCLLTLTSQKTVKQKYKIVLVAAIFSDEKNKTRQSDFHCYGHSINDNYEHCCYKTESLLQFSNYFVRKLSRRQTKHSKTFITFIIIMYTIEIVVFSFEFETIRPNRQYFS